MSYLQLDKGLPNFSKLVISLWFRVPQSSADTTFYNSGEDVPLNGIIPLVVMGKRGKGNTPTRGGATEVVSVITTGYDTFGRQGSFEDENLGPTACAAYSPYSTRMEGTRKINEGIAYEPVGPFYAYRDQYTLSQTGPAPDTDPTVIGIDCSGSTSFLYVNFETTQVPQVSGSDFTETISPGPVQSVPGIDSFEQGTIVTQWCSQPFGLLITPIPGTLEVISDDTHTVTQPDGTSTGDPVYSYNDVSSMEINATGAIRGGARIEVTSDHWHHLLVSVELETVEVHGGESEGSTAEFVDSAAKLYIALDDVNYTGFDLSDNWPDGGEPNAIITDDAWQIAGQFPPENNDGGVLGIPHYTLPNPTVPSSGVAIGIPATSEFVDRIKPVEMAELQIWTGVSLNTGVVSNRRAFIDADGNPVSPVAPPAVEGQPPQLPPAETLLGKPPEILLHGSGNWITGRNTGAEPSGSIDPDTKPADSLTSAGWIIPYAPEPSLHGPQGSDAVTPATAREIETV